MEQHATILHLAVLAQVDALALLEVVSQEVHDALVKVVATQVCVTRCGQHLEHAVAHLQQKAGSWSEQCTLQAKALHSEPQLFLAKRAPSLRLTSSTDTSNVPPPRSKTRMVSLDFLSKPYARDAAVGSLMIRSTCRHIGTSSEHAPGPSTSATICTTCI